jgi:hypothetical protein
MSTGKETSTGRAANLTFRGVMSAAVVAERKAASVASDLFRLARRCENPDQFEAKCQMEEEWVISEEAGQMRCIEIPRCWVQAKSDIRGAWKAGLDLTNFPSYYKMKAAKVEANKQAKSNSAEGEAHAERNPKHGAEKSRDAKPDSSLAEALANGDVVDAKSTELVPAQLRELVGLLSNLSNKSELRAAQRIKEFTKIVRDDLSLIGTERKRGQQSRVA